MKRLTIIGASGQGRVVADIARLNGYDDIIFLDDNPSLRTCGEYPVVGTTHSNIVGDFFVAIGNAQIRKNLINNSKPVVLIHPNAVIAKDVQIDDGTVVMAGAVINSGTFIGKGCIINTCSSVDHDCIIKDFVHISVGAHVCGTVNVGSMTWIGAGSIVSNNLTICEQTMIGAGATVIKDISTPGTYVGTPAHLVDKSDLRAF